MAEVHTSTLSPVLLTYAKSLYKEHRYEYYGDGFDKFLERLGSPACDAMATEPLDTSHPLSNYFISSSHNTYLSGNQLYSRSSATPYQHVSALNVLLTRGSLCQMPQVLERGCRCVEIDVWDGEPASMSDSEGEDDDNTMHRLRHGFKKGLHMLHSHQSDTNSAAEPDSPNAAQPTVSQPEKGGRHGRIEPRVLHGHTATKEIPFRKVCETIRDYAFASSNLPLIVSLEIHTSAEQQELMVEIMRDLWGPYLVDQNLHVDNSTPLPALEALKKKILIKVKYSPPVDRSSKQKTDGKDGNESDGEGQYESIKKGKIIPQLGSMGVYTRSFHFKSFDKPEATIPTHVFALAEGKLIEVHKRDPATLFAHNQVSYIVMQQRCDFTTDYWQNYLMRAYPKGLRVSSSNLDPPPFWRQGVQMVALNWQTMNAAMMLNGAMFEGTDGYVLKPEGYQGSLSTNLATTQPSSIRRGTLNLAIEVFGGQNIGPSGKRITPYIRCELHVEGVEERRAGIFAQGGQSKEGELKARTEIGQGGRNPDFKRQVLEFKDVQSVTEDLSFVR